MGTVNKGGHSSTSTVELSMLTGTSGFVFGPREMAPFFYSDFAEQSETAGIVIPHLLLSPHADSGGRLTRVLFPCYGIRDLVEAHLGGLFNDLHCDRTMLK